MKKTVLSFLAIVASSAVFAAPTVSYQVATNIACKAVTNNVAPWALRGQPKPAGGEGSVSSVNGRTGDVVIVAADIDTNYTVVSNRALKALVLDEYPRTLEEYVSTNEDGTVVKNEIEVGWGANGPKRDLITTKTNGDIIEKHIRRVGADWQEADDLGIDEIVTVVRNDMGVITIGDRHLEVNGEGITYDETLNDGGEVTRTVTGIKLRDGEIGTAAFVEDFAKGNQSFVRGVTSVVTKAYVEGLGIGTEIIDNTTSHSPTNALSANMGRELQEQIQNLKQRGRYLSVWNAATGLAETTATVSPYPYKAGDYFIVGVVGSPNYRPYGTEYTNGVPSTAVETASLAANDTYYFDGTVWSVIHAPIPAVTFAALAGEPSDNTALAAALNAKEDVIDDLAAIRSGAEAGATAVQPHAIVIAPVSEGTSQLADQSVNIVANLTELGNGTWHQVNYWVDGTVEPPATNVSEYDSWYYYGIYNGSPSWTNYMYTVEDYRMLWNSFDGKWYYGDFDYPIEIAEAPIDARRIVMVYDADISWDLWTRRYDYQCTLAVPQGNVGKRDFYVAMILPSLYETMDVRISGGEVELPRGYDSFRELLFPGTNLMHFVEIADGRFAVDTIRENWLKSSAWAKERTNLYDEIMQNVYSSLSGYATRSWVNFNQSLTYYYTKTTADGRYVRTVNGLSPSSGAVYSRYQISSKGAATSYSLTTDCYSYKLTPSANFSITVSPSVSYSTAQTWDMVIVIEPTASVKISSLSISNHSVGYIGDQPSTKTMASGEVWVLTLTKVTNATGAVRVVASLNKWTSGI